MIRWVKTHGEKLIVLALVLILVYTSIIFMSFLGRLSDSAARVLWEQSIETELRNENESYYEELYRRYSKMNSSLNDYQRNTQIRLDSLSNRVESLESEVKALKALSEKEVCSNEY
jgi:polyhydroxyalkanoate synthesis regulator phasin